MNRYSSSRSRATKRPFIAFLLVLSFGILFAGCTNTGKEQQEFVFTADDVARYRGLAEDTGTGGLTGSGRLQPTLEPLASGSGLTADAIVLDLSMREAYAAMRSQSLEDQNRYQVTNTFLNVRSTPSTNGAIIRRLDLGDPVDVTEIIDGQWAKVMVPGGGEGYAAHKYLARTTSEERLAEEKKRFENMYTVNFKFVNMRKEPQQGSEKLAEIPGQALLKPESIVDGWAKVKYQDKEGYVSRDYLAPFQMTFLVRQDSFRLPVLRYNLQSDRFQETLTALGTHAAALKAQGYTFITFRQFYDLLLAQQKRDVRLEGKRVIVALSGITPKNVRAVSDQLNQSGINATLFLQTDQVGLSGITEKMILTLLANGFDVQSGSHSGDDLRAMTNAQVELELKRSRSILEQYTGKTIFAVAFPQGGTNDRVSSIASDVGYLLGVGDEGRNTFLRSEFLHLPALTVFPSTSAEEIERFVTP